MIRQVITSTTEFEIAFTQGEGETTIEIYDAMEPAQSYAVVVNTEELKEVVAKL